MDDKPQAEMRRNLELLLARTLPPEWLREMIAHYRKTGTFRAQDLRRLLGDPTKGVEMGPSANLESLLSTWLSNHR